MDASRLLRRKRETRALRTRRRLRGTPDRPRLSVFRSGRQIYAQIIDDSRGETLAAAASSLSPVREAVPKGWTKPAAAAVGQRIAELALAKGIRAVRFDRGAYKYHGRVKALADAARKGGLSF